MTGCSALTGPFNSFETIGTAYGMMALCSTACGVELVQSQAEIEALPQRFGKLLSIYPENDIETYRDVLYFTAQVLGGFFCINREGKLEFRQYGEDSGDGDFCRSTGFPAVSRIL